MSEDFTQKPKNGNDEILTAITRLEEAQKRLELDQRAIDSKMTLINSQVNSVELDQRVINDAVRRMQMDFITVNEWLQKLTVNRNQQNSST